MRKRPIYIRWIFVVIPMLIAMSAESGWAGEESLFIKIAVKDVAVEKGVGEQAVFQCRGVQWLNGPGEPDIPWQVMTVLLPHDVLLDTVEIRLTEDQLETLPGKWVVVPSSPEITWKDGKQAMDFPKDKRLVDGRHIEIYEKDAFWPYCDARVLNVGCMRKWRLAQVAVPLIRYNPVTGTLQRLVDGTLEVGFDRISSLGVRTATGAEFADQIGEDAVRRMAVNFDDQYGSYALALEQTTQADLEGSGFSAESEAEPAFVIITTFAIQAVSTQLASFVTLKAFQGFDVRIITEDIWGGGVGDTAAENIREWLQDNYVTENIEYVLLMGNPHPTSGDVPMKMTYPKSGYSAPTDYYYADLTGNWDLDNDGLYGEFIGDFGTGGVDRNWEVIVGRIPYYGEISDLDSILLRSIAYQSEAQDATAWRKNVLLPMNDLGDWYPLSDRLGEDIKDDILDEAGWSYHRIYDSNILGLDPAPETMPCTKDNVVNVWGNEAFGLVVWWAHGSATGSADVIDSNRVDELDDEYKAFTFQASCHTATPEQTNNLAYELLQHGAISTVGATRSSWSIAGHNIRGEATVEGMAYEYTAKLVSMGMPSGLALNALRQEIAPDSNYPGQWMNYVGCNVYGDPSACIYMPELRVHNMTRGTSYPVIQWAIDDAEEGDDLVLDPGTYDGIGNRDIRFRGKAVTLRSEDPDDPAIVASTIIDGGGIWAFRLLDEEDHNSVLSGLTITNGSNGVYCSQSSPTITKCVITGNDSRGIYLRNSDALITDCTFVGNGGGLEISVGNPEVTDCIFIGNQADRGGAISISSSSEIVISGCTMTGNSAGIEGGAVRGSANGGLIIEACSISGNTALEKGGGLYVYGTVNVVNTTITGNTAGQGGGIYTPICSPRITNCTLSENRASDSGGGICFFGSTAEITNTILWNNSAQSSGPEMALMAHFSSYFPTTVLTSYCDVLGGESSVFVENTNCTLTWQNSMDADPSFVDPGSWDDRGTTDNLSDDIWNEGVYRLTAGSPCIDAGTSDEAPDMDCEGNGRYDDPSTEDTGGGAFTFYDIGAFEFGGGPIFCPADLEGDDNDVDGSDLAVLANDPALLDLASFAEKFGTSVCLP